MSGIFWWTRQILFILVGAFFLYYGIELLIYAYELREPHSFLMTFFASNLIILISATLIFGFAYRIFSVYRELKKPDSKSG